MKTLKDLKEEITRINNIDMEGFDNGWVLRKFARDQALISIVLIKPYTDKYNLMVRFLVTGKDADVATQAAVTAYDAAVADTKVAVATDSSAYTAVTYAVAAIYATSETDATSAAASAATYAAYATDADTDYTESIASLETLTNEYLALLPEEGE